MQFPLKEIYLFFKYLLVLFEIFDIFFSLLIDFNACWSLQLIKLAFKQFNLIEKLVDLIFFYQDHIFCELWFPRLLIVEFNSEE